MGDAITLIAQHDFPEHWPSLMPQLVHALSATDYLRNQAVLMAVHQLCKKYRHEFRTDLLFGEIKLVVGQFAAAFRELLQNTDALIQQNVHDKQALAILLHSLLLMAKIYYSLNAQDLPEYFEDHHQDFMGTFLKYVQFSNKLVDADDDEAGVVEKV